MARPKLYTAHGTIGEVLAFIHGYETGLYEARRGAQQREPSEVERELADLKSWLHATAGLTGDVWHGELAKALTRTFPNKTRFFAACRDFLEKRAESQCA